jgi:hypothetical protein
MFGMLNAKVITVDPHFEGVKEAVLTKKVFLNQPHRVGFFLTWVEEQHLSFVVLPKPKSDDAMLDST